MDLIIFAYNKPMPKSRTTQKHFQTFNQHKKTVCNVHYVAIDLNKKNWVLFYVICFFLLSIHRFNLIKLIITEIIVNIQTFMYNIHLYKY